MIQYCRHPLFRVRQGLAGLLFAALLAGCGGGGQPSSGPRPASPPTPGTTGVSATAKDDAEVRPDQRPRVKTFVPTHELTDVATADHERTLPAGTPVRLLERYGRTSVVETGSARPVRH
jgi:hypothetical protein